MGEAAAIKEAVARVDPRQPIAKISTMEALVSETKVQPRFRAELVGAFAALAIGLAAAGVFGVIAFSVSQRTREFGIRSALGARTGDILRIVIAGGLRITAAGIAVGLAGAAVLTRSLGSLLFGVEPTDPVTFLAASAIPVVVALIACVAPALRAATVDPSVALRQE